MSTSAFDSNSGQIYNLLTALSFRLPNSFIPAGNLVKSAYRLNPGTLNKGATPCRGLEGCKAVGPLLLALGLIGFMVMGCGATESQRPSSQSGSLDGTEVSAVTVFAAASLADAFKSIAAAYESEYPESEVVLNFDGSQRLRTQLEHGAQADVFASADREQMAAVESRGLTASPPVNFASNGLVLLVYAGDNPMQEENPSATAPLSIKEYRRRLEELAVPDTKIVLGQPAVPIGAYTELMLENMAEEPSLGQQLADGLRANVVSQEASVRAIVQKVNLGEADAGVAYLSDASVVSTGVRVLRLPDSINVTAHYPIAALTNAPGASSFVDFVLSEPGQQILRDYGFGPPLSGEGTNP